MEEEKYYAEALAALKGPEGDESDARELLNGFLSAVEQRQAIPGPILEYLYAAFASYLSNRQEPKERPGPLERALLLTKGRGRPDGSSRTRIKEGRIYTDTAIAALFNLLLKRGKARADALAALEDRICPARSVEQYATNNNCLKNWTPAELRRLIRDEREIAKSSLTESQRQLIIQGRQKKSRK